VYVTRQQARTAIVEHVVATHEAGQPMLIGTLDVAESERLAVRLRRIGVPCSVLNAKNDAAEAAVIAEAAAFGAVTVSTQLAGRGIDIRPGGADQHDAERVIAAGGLCVIGTGRHVSSRLDNQLRGRCGRQGDPGRSLFFASLEDDLVVRHATDMELPAAGDDRGRLSAAQVGRIMEHAQLVAEAQMLEIHTNTWRYNQVIEQQRSLIGQRRDRVLRTDQALRDLEDPCAARLAELRGDVEESVLVEAARLITLFHLDRCWAEHLAYLADVREGIHLHAVGRNNPLDEFHRVAIPAFTRDVADNIRSRAIESFDQAVITSDGVDLAVLGLRRPATTWTYMVRDNPFEPFESGIERSVRAMRTRSRQPTTR
jgi:preprotein translocase subunit SecA